MVRSVSALALTVAIAFSGTVVAGAMSDAAAKGKAGVCMKTTLDGKVKKWSCKTDEVCCGFPLFGYYSCGTKMLGCIIPKQGSAQGASRSQPTSSRAPVLMRPDAERPSGVRTQCRGWPAPQETDGREAGTSAARSSGTIVRRCRRIRFLRPEAADGKFICAGRNYTRGSPTAKCTGRTASFCLSTLFLELRG